MFQKELQFLHFFYQTKGPLKSAALNVTFPMFFKLIVYSCFEKVCPKKALTVLKGTMLKGTMGNASLNFTMLKHGRLITITNQVQSLNCKLQTEFFPLQFMAQVQNTWATTQRGKNKNP